MHTFIKKTAKLIFRDYQIYKIYFIDIQNYELSNLDINLQELSGVFRPIQLSDDHSAGFSGPEAYGYEYLSSLSHTEALAQCWYWYGERYKVRNFWPLNEKEAKLVDIETTQKARGMGIAPALIAYSCAQMKENGFKKLYARIWHSNKPSIKAFSKAGWQPLKTIIEFYFLGRKLRLEFISRKRKTFFF
ncbi:GNAT family N-acetyltransferase [Paremcibacter congregatus]|uniref:N-acetyltransferase domain-containing protein n=1 Tax=Paremcibacter congregatus TaxID=2043170 RepID=A0A2G4YMW4_9PROT|nr:GNAT family N-acetyltransferase [Paremcibacter congregatus]PHZ83674.1 hypothetical protein CRD36_14960 [Paremcibacter congregatus]QDE27377.1 GNAT family N-acetyltransferase [Paremcibacter congregatus]